LKGSFFSFFASFPPRMWIIGSVDYVNMISDPTESENYLGRI